MEFLRKILKKKARFDDYFLQNIWESLAENLQHAW